MCAQGQKEGPYDRQTLLGEQEEPMLRTADMFMAHTLPGVEAGAPTYVEEPQGELNTAPHPIIPGPDPAATNALSSESKTRISSDCQHVYGPHAAWARGWGAQIYG